MKIRLTLFFSALIVVMSVLTSCVRFGGNVPPQKTYLLSVKKPKAEKQRTKQVLFVQDAIAISPYGSTLFLYRKSHVRFLTDYYHVFLTPPDAQISHLIARYLSGARLFGQVLQSSALAGKTSFMLQPTIEALYADYSNAHHPRARMTLRFAFYHGPKHKLLFKQTFSSAVALREKTNKALVLAWNQDLANILSRLTHRLRGVVLNPVR
jgi:ABC-type uncharacterized transport system auxiliary subunit